MKFIFPIIAAALLGFGVAWAQDGAGGDTPLSSIGDAGAGRTVFQKCQACHSLTPRGPALAGPNLDNFFGRMAGTSANYNGYSKALMESGIIWNEWALDQWLRDPQNFLPGNKMPFAGIRTAKERADLMAYLREETED